MNRVTLPHAYRFTVVIEADATGGYYAFCPALPGCYSQGETPEETKAHIQEAIQCHLESLVKGGETLPHEPEEFISAVEVTISAKHER